MRLEKSNIKPKPALLKRAQEKTKKERFNIAEKKSHYSPPRFAYCYMNGKYYIVRLSRKKHEPMWFSNSPI
jgi:hypothetical protein